MLDPKSLIPGNKYVIQITGCVRPVVALCLDKKDRYDWYIVKVLNNGFMHDAELQHEDYIPEEAYDETKHGLIET